MPSVVSAKRKLNFDEPRIYRMEPEFTRAPVWKKKKGRRLDFGETDPSVLLYCPDLLPNRTDPEPVTRRLPTRPSSKVDRVIFTAEQKSQLEALFRKKMFPVRKEKQALAADLNVPFNKVTTWFSNRRQKFRKEQKKALVGPSGTRPVLPGSSLIQTSYHRSFQSTVGFSHSAEFPPRLEVPSQRFPDTPYPVSAPLPSESNLITRSHPLPAPLPCRQVYPPFPAPVHRIPQQYPDIYHHQTAASCFPTHHFIPPVVGQPEIHQGPGSDPKTLADEFPFSYSVAKELPHIFGNIAEDEVLVRPLTPSFELPVEFGSICDSLSLESDRSVETSSLSSYSSWTSEDFADCVQPSAFESYCFGSNRDFSCTFVSQGKNIEFYRED